MYHWSFTGVNCRKLVLIMPEVYDSTNSTPQNKTVSALEYRREIIKQVRTNMAINEGKNNPVQFSHSVTSDSLQSHEPHYVTPPCPSPTPRVHPNPCPFCQWCHPTISSSVVPFSSCLQSFPASGSFQMSQLSTSGGQSVGVSASASVPPTDLL